MSSDYTLGRTPEDFVVEELASREPEGRGPHTHLWIEKRETTTEAVAKQLARKLGVHSREVGYAGRKDRNAVARQWFSVPRIDPGEAVAWGDDRYRVLRAERDPEKIRTGRLEGNRFELCVRDVSSRALASLEERLRRLTERGMPNRFGAQRFGRDGDNAERGRAVLIDGARVRSRREARFLVSAWQSQVFNDVLARRAWDRLESGDLAFEHATRRTQRVDVVDEDWQARCRSFRWSPSGPVFGARAPLAAGEPGELERQVLDPSGVPAPDRLEMPRGLRVPGARRPLRVHPGALEVETLAACDLKLRFSLPAGSYATVLVEELLG